MSSQVEVRKTVYNKEQLERVVDNTFTTFTQPSPEIDTDTPEELFRLYEKLYLVIDVEGETDSHEYLARRSSELVDFDKNTEEIQLLLDEIAQLRSQLLLANQQIIDLETRIE